MAMVEIERRGADAPTPGPGAARDGFDRAPHGQNRK
jgi:hypothetical protein